MTKGPVPVPPLERALRYIDMTSDCWVWTGQIDTKGYGVIRVGSVYDGSRRKVRAHRLVYEEVVGEIPEGMTLDHLCHNEDVGCIGGTRCPHRRCVNPDHLEPTTSVDNLLRARTPVHVEARRQRTRVA